MPRKSFRMQFSARVAQVHQPCSRDCKAFRYLVNVPFQPYTAREYKVTDMALKCNPTFITTFEPIDVCPLCVEQKCHGPQFVTTTMQRKIGFCHLPFVLEAVSLRDAQPFSCRPIKTISIILSVTVPVSRCF